MGRILVFGRVQFAGGHLAVGVDERLLVDAPDALDSADVVGVLRSQVAWVLGLDLPVSLIAAAIRGCVRNFVCGPSLIF